MPRPHRQAEEMGRRILGLLSAALGIWLVVLGASASSDLGQVAGALVGVAAVGAGLGLVLVGAGRRPHRGPGGPLPTGRRSGHLVLLRPSEDATSAAMVAAAQDSALELGAAG